MSQYNKSRGGAGNRESAPTHSVNLADVDLTQPGLSLYDTTAERIAATIATSNIRNANKATQLRGFYDEIVMWEQRCRRLSDTDFNQQLPLIRMINAKVAYARGRDLVDDNFFRLIRHCLDQVKTRETLRNCKLFLEAFMGFYKIHREKN